MARGAYEAALRYSQQRRQFGRAYREFEAIQFYLAEMATEIDAARAPDAARPPRRGTRAEADRRFSAQAKLLRLRNRASASTDRALQIHGGYGFIKDFPVEKFYRDVKLCTIGEGTTRDPEARDRAAAPLGRLVTAAAPSAEVARRCAGRAPIGRAIIGSRARRRRRAGAPETPLSAHRERARHRHHGPPGAGKSTLVAASARRRTAGGADASASWRWTRRLRSPAARSSGDRIRMAEIYTDPGVFIRSMATRGELGGLARATSRRRGRARRGGLRRRPDRNGRRRAGRGGHRPGRRHRRGRARARPR